MSFPVMNFPILTPEQAMPGFTAAGKFNQNLAQIYQNQLQQLQNQQQGIQNQYLPQSLQQKALADQYNNAILQQQAKYAPQMTLADLQQKQANIPHTQAETQEILQGKIPLDQAEAKYKTARIDPFNDPANMPDLMKAEMYYNHIKNQYGDKHPLTVEALNNYRMLQQQQMSNSNWHQQLAETTGFRALPTVAKELLNQQQAQSGLQPSGINNIPIGQIGSGSFSSPQGGSVDLNRPFGSPMQTLSGSPIPSQQQGQGQQQIQPQVAQQGQPQQPQQLGNVPAQGVQSQSPDQTPPVNQQTLSQAATSVAAQQVGTGEKLSPKDVSDKIANAVLKTTNTAQNLNKIQFGSQVEQTIKNMLPYEYSVEYYTGIGGRSKLMADMAKSAVGINTPEYMAYQNYKTLSQSAARQMRQYWGDSIQPSAMKDLDELTDPAAWNRSPEVVRSRLNAVIHNFNTELEQRKDAAQGPDIYKKNASEIPLISGDQQNITSPAQNASSETVKILDPSGKEHVILRSNLDIALKRHPGTKLAE